MKSIDDLFSAVNTHLHNHGSYPKVFVARSFWEEHASDIAKLHKDGLEIEVVNHLQFRSFYLIGTIHDEQHVDTVNDLYEVAKKLKEEGKGDWPVRNMPPDANVYLPIQFHPVVPHKDEEDGVERFAAIASNPEREFILVVIGDIGSSKL